MFKQKVKISTAQKTMKDPELIDMFNKMVGCGEPDPNIVIPKYEKIMNNSETIILILESFMNSPIYATFYQDFNISFGEIKNYIDSAKKSFEELKLEKNEKILSGEELNQINSDLEKLQEYLMNMDLQYKISKLGESYNNLKDSIFVKEAIMIARNLKNVLMMEKERSGSEFHDLENPESLKNNFILKADGDFLKLFNFTNLDFKQLMYHELMNPELNEYLLKFLHLLYIRCINIVKEITSPDIDVEKFSELLVKNIDEIRRQIPRCDKAFNKIKESVELLKSNFGEYYKDFVSSKNPGIIIENFVSDVARNSEADASTTRQFREIINFYRKRVQNKIQDPKVKKIFEMVSENLDILEKM